MSAANNRHEEMTRQGDTTRGREKRPLVDSCYCTLALTEALPVRVNVHVFTLFPPLEQAPDQITSRVFVALSVIEVPVVNVAEPVLPTATLIPAAFRIIAKPVRTSSWSSTRMILMGPQADALCALPPGVLIRHHPTERAGWTS